MVTITREIRVFGILVFRRTRRVRSTYPGAFAR